MKSRVFKYLIVAAVVFMTIAASSGCVWYYSNIEWSDTRTVMYKPDVDSYTGQMAVYWNDRIYYVSDETGRDGIHSMKPDGSDVRFEFEVPMSTRLIATDQAFYYVGVYKTGEKNHKFFALFKKAQGEEAKIIPTVYEYADSVYDAYIDKNGTIAVLETHYIGTSIPTSEFLEFVNVDAKQDYNDDKKYFHFMYVDEVQDILYSTEITNKDEENPMIDPTVVDLSTGSQVMSSKRLDDDHFYKLLYADDDEIVMCENNTIVFLDRYTREVNNKITISGTNEEMKIDYVFKCSDGFMAIVKQEDRNNDKLFYINTDTDETTEIMGLNDKVLIDTREGRVLYAQGDMIRCQSVSKDGLGEIIYEIKMPGNVVRDNVFEIAGDWLLVHKRALQAGAETNQLQYKLNLVTQEVIDVR